MDFLEDSARGPHHPHLTTALAARYLTLRYGAFPGPDDVPFLDLIALEDPLAHTALRSGYFAAPSLATLSLGYLVVRSPAPKPSST